MKQKNSNSTRWPRRLLIAGLIGLVVAAFWLGRASRSPEAKASEGMPVEPGESHAEEPHLHAEDEDGTVYYCSMHPNQQSTDPDATCPICGMDMVPMPEGADTGDLPELKVSERSAALMNIEVSPVERRPIEVPIHFVGKLQADETLLRDVVVRSDSYVEKLHGDFKWKHVHEGELLAELYSPAVKAAARELLVVSRSERKGRNSLEASRANLRRLGVSPEQIDRILAEGEVPDTYEIRSPIGGHLMMVSGRQGHWLKEGQRLVQVMDPSNLWVRLQAYESDLQWVRVGDRVEVTAPQAFPGERFEGEVTFVEPHVDDNRRTAEIRLDVPNPDGRLKPGTFVRATVQGSLPGGNGGFLPTRPEGPAESKKGRDSILIPDSAPLITGKRALVYVKRPDVEPPTYEGREITLGPKAGEYYVVREGLEEGELVVSRGAFKIDSELQIRGRPSMMQPVGQEESSEPAGHTH